MRFLKLLDMKTRTTNAVRALGALMLCAGLLFSGCYDDSALRDQLKAYGEQLSDHESRLKELETLCSQMNTNIEALQTIVSALQDKDYVTGIAPIKEGDKVLGYSITFSKSGAVTIYDGKDGYVPSLGVKREGDQWYWTLDGEWLTDADGNKVRASAKDDHTPTLKIEGGYWYVSFDGGKTWESDSLGQATGDKGDSMFEAVAYDEAYVYITMSDGQQLTLPRTSASQGGGDDEGAGETNDAITNTSGGVTLTVMLRNLTEMGVSFYGEAVLAENYTASSFGILYSEIETFTAATAQNLQIVDIYGTNYSVSTSSLEPFTTYYYTSYIKQGELCKYGEIKSFTTAGLVAPTLNAAMDITEVSATIGGTVSLAAGTASDLEYGFQYSTSSDFSSGVTSKKITEMDSENKFSISISSLMPGTSYYYRSYIKMQGVYAYGDIKDFTTLKHPYQLSYDLNVSSAIDLSSSASANCYIVSNAGLYKFKTVKGNSSKSVGNVASTSILWETFGTSEIPEPLDLIKAFCYKDGYIAFQTADVFKEGNAIIAAKDASGTILWSWHIWLTDQPQGQEYFNNAGTMMDRNLGATSATPGDVGALGLLYQWGRKDPFLGSSSISDEFEVKSTINWPSAVSSDSSTGTIAYATVHPTTFIECNSSNNDWYYTGSLLTDNTRWTTSESTKSIYDPCPAGWRVPDGGSNGVWSKACGSSSSFSGYPYNSTNEGMDFSGKFGSASTIWYPASGYRYYGRGGLSSVGNFGNYWSASPNGFFAYSLCFDNNGSVLPSDDGNRASGLSVRCLQVID